MNMKPLTKDEIDIMIEDYNGGLTQQEISRKYHHSARTLTPILKPQFENRKKLQSKEKEYKAYKKPIRKVDNVYADAFRFGRACGKTDREIWDGIHKVWEKHSIKWESKDLLRNKETHRKYTHHTTVYRMISENTVHRIFKWMRDNKLTQAQVAKENGFAPNIFTRLKNSRKMRGNRNAYKQLKKLCTDNNIKWEDSLWEESE